MFLNRQSSRLALCVALISGISAPAFSQEAPASQEQSANNGGGLADIVVTAQKRSESLSKTPLAISVIGQQNLDNVGARSFADGIKTIPSVSAGIGNTLAIRGLGTFTQAQENGTVAYHIDGIFQNALGQSSTALYDIQRIEVLRGPQGTLYGRNATAGVVNVLTNDAAQKFEAAGDVSYGRYNALQFRGMVNAPLNDELAVRLSGTYASSDSWQVFDGRHPRGEDTLTLRLAVQGKISDRITWNGKIDYRDANGLQPSGNPVYIYSGGAFTHAGNAANGLTFPSNAGTDGLQNPALGLPYDSVYQGIDFEQGNTRPTRAVAFRSNLRFDLNDELSLTYLMGYSHENQRPGYISGLGVYQIRYAQPRLSDDWSHEIDLNYDSDKFKGVLGLYSFDHTLAEKDMMVRIFDPVVLPGNVVDFQTPSVDVSSSSPRDKSQTRAVFGQGTYSVTDSLRLTAGARYNWDKSSFADYTFSQCPFGSGLSAAQPDVATFPVFLGPLGGAPVCSTFASFVPQFFVNKPVPGGERKFEKFSWKGSLEYDLNADSLLYATVSTGYKAGGIGDREAIGDARFFRPETNINYEVGARTKLLNDTVSLNLTGFWTDYKDLQVQQIDPNDPTRSIAVNAGKARSRGVEFEYVWAPTRADRIQGFATYLDAKFRDFQGANSFTGQSEQFAGNSLPAAPKFSARISYSHIFDLGDAGTITPTAQLYYQSASYSSFVQNVATRVPDYTSSDLFIRYESAAKRFSIDAYVNNIEDKTRITSVSPASSGGSTYVVGFRSQPRTYGVRLGFRY